MRIAVAMSGGVDSSTVFMKLKEEGHDVFGVSMRHLPKELAGDRVGSCCAPGALRAAMRLANGLSSDHYTFDLSSEFADEVMKVTAEEYASGRTPNPCVLCNERVKLRLLWARAKALGADRLATGHYARIIDGKLYCGVDAARDQAYFLYRIGPKLLSKLLFPLGEFTKPQVREMARRFGLEMSDKQDSVDVCFAPNGDFTYVFRRFAPEALMPGEIRYDSGDAVGRHGGVGTVTVGQRRRLGIASENRLYVTRIDPASRSVVVGARPISSSLTARGAVWLDDLPEAFSANCRIRSRHKGTRAEVEKLDHDCFRVRFAAPEAAITPGQSVVLYRGEQVLGGGFISTVK